MKNALRTLLLVVIAFSVVSFAQQQAKIKIEGVTPHRLTTLGFTQATNSVSTGLPVVANQTFVYLSPQNIAANAAAITNAAFTFTSKPNGSTAAFTTFNTNWVFFKPDVKGAYAVKLVITTASGTDDTTITITSADYVGVGNFEGVAGTFPKCMTCHSSNTKFSGIYDKWKTSGHAIVFQREVEGSDHYGKNCMVCHTTGYDHGPAASNNGFDDLAAQLGWSFTTSSSTTFDTIKTNFPNLVNHATIGCESCHGAGSEHANGGDRTKIAISLQDGACAQCHDEPPRHSKVAEYELSAHSEAIWETSFAQGASSQNNSLANCIRCHNGTGYVNFTKGLTTNTTGMNGADHVAVTCATCHDPHSGTLRESPAASDTLANKFNYTTVINGSGKLCFDCHKARGNAATVINTAVTQRWGPHHSTQGDVLVGQNALDFGTPFMSGAHSVVSDACVHCHMTDIATDGTVNMNHSFSMTYNGADRTTSCAACHGTKSSFENFEATSDYDGDGTVESSQEEVDGLLAILVRTLPPAGDDSVSWTKIAQGNDLNTKKAYWNYQLIANDGSRGVHNTKFAVDVLTKSIAAIGGVVPVELVSFTAEVSEGYVNLKWQTATETNNKGFEVEKQLGNSWKTVGFVPGKGTSAATNSYSYSVKLEGKASFRLKQVDFDGSVHYSKVVEAAGTVTPKDYTLLQNYPNPFNPSTTIKFSLPTESNVKVVVYNITGQVVKVLASGTFAAGNHDVNFNTNEVGSKVSSGIYFYSLEANAVNGNASFRQTKKMILMK